MEITEREIWFDGRNIPLERYDLWSLVNNSPLEKILISPEQRKDGHFPQKTRFITEIREPRDLEGIQPGATVFSDRPGLLDLAMAQGFDTCIFLAVNQQQSLEQACQLASQYHYVVVDFDLPTNIPLELFIARLEERKTVLLRRAVTAAETEVAFGVLEKGSDGVLFAGADPGEIKAVTDLLHQTAAPPLELQPLTVTLTRHIGMGWRSCVDTTGLMTQAEGMLVGSTSAGGIMVCSETHYLPYMNLRPFRVNAGAIHSYIWMPNNNAGYLSELEAGSKVLCVNRDGGVRELTVGRVKTEIRPLLLIKGEIDGRPLNVIVQDDWHIRLMGADGQPKNATLIQPGDRLLGYLCQQGRHVGISVSETIIER
jgi:3-dehydroquinate synthase II/3-amino-4-hydroxybenzoic acid synthase